MKGTLPTMNRTLIPSRTNESTIASACPLKWLLEIPLRSPPCKQNDLPCKFANDVPECSCRIHCLSAKHLHRYTYVDSIIAAQSVAISGITTYAIIISSSVQSAGLSAATAQLHLSMISAIAGHATNAVVGTHVRPDAAGVAIDPRN